MTEHRIGRATPHEDFTVDIEWSDGSRSVADFKPEIARGGVMADLGEPAVFLDRLFIHARGESIGWEVFGKMIDFDADNLWRDTHKARSAAE
jgi:hypothetical protein